MSHDLPEVPESAKCDPLFWACVHEAASIPEFVENWARLYGIKLPAPARSPIERMIDGAVKLDERVGAQFLAFVYRFVYLTLPKAEAA